MNTHTHTHQLRKTPSCLCFAAWIKANNNYDLAFWSHFKIYDRCFWHFRLVKLVATGKPVATLVGFDIHMESLRPLLGLAFLACTFFGNQCPVEFVISTGGILIGRSWVSHLLWWCFQQRGQIRRAVGIAHIVCYLEWQPLGMFFWAAWCTS